VVAEGPGHVRDTDLLLHECGLQAQLNAVASSGEFVGNWA
jgi:hypothetical protein